MGVQAVLQLCLLQQDIRNDGRRVPRLGPDSLTLVSRPSMEAWGQLQRTRGRGTSTS